MDIAIIPDEMSTDMTVDIPFSTAVNESEAGISGRKSTRDIPLRTYTMTINPDGAEEVQAILLAHLGARWPVALKDWAANYALTLEPQTYTFTTDTTVSSLVKTYTPATGSRTFTQRILIPDEDTIAIYVNGSPLTSGITWSITDPGILVINTLLTSGDVLTVSCNYWVPAVFVDDMLSMTVHVDTLFSIDGLRLKEIPEQELIDLLGL